MSIAITLSLFIALVGLAIVPGMGMFTVMARTLNLGLTHGVVTVFGIVLGDIVFIIIALLALVSANELMTNFFLIIKYLGGGYLLWLGTTLFLSKAQTVAAEKKQAYSYGASFILGLVTTLSNPKVILFYVSFLPALLGNVVLSLSDALIIIVTALFAVGAIMLIYAYAASRVSRFLKADKIQLIINRVVGTFIFATGAFVLSFR